MPGSSHQAGRKRSGEEIHEPTRKLVVISDGLPSVDCNHPSPSCFRISGIPDHWIKKDVELILLSVDSGLNNDNHQLSLYPSCYGSQKTALLNLECSSAYFSTLTPTENRILSIQDEAHVQLVLDRHFLDLTPLNTPSDNIMAE
jgi:hypothetical protein